MAVRSAKTQKARDVALSQRHIDFCSNIVRGMSSTQACTLAGWKHTTCHSDWPSKMLRDPRIVERIELMRAQAAQRLHYDVAKIIGELEDVQARAKRANKYGSELQAIIAKAEMLGLKPKDRSEIDVNILYKPVGEPTKQLDLSVEEWEARWSPKEIGNGHG